MLAKYNSLPLWVRKAVTDFVETGLTVLVGLNLAFPTSLHSAEAEAAVVGMALLGAAISAGRRAIPTFLAWFKTLTKTA